MFQRILEVQALAPHLPFAGVIGLQLHHLQDTLTRIRAILRVAIDRDRLLQRPYVLLPMHIDASSALLRDLANSRSLTSNDRTHHFTLDEQTKREVSLATRTTGHAIKLLLLLLVVAVPRVAAHLLLLLH